MNLLRVARSAVIPMTAGAIAMIASTAIAQGPRLAQAPFSSLTWRNIGPTALGGHVDRIAVGRVKGQPDAIYVIGTTGGAFKSVTGGVTWTPIFDEMNAMMSMGDVAVAPSNASIVWIGTGESANSPYYWGDGVYKSTDAGKTWTNMGLRDTRHIGRILIHPTNPDIVWIAAQGHNWGPNAERGVFKTTDGGKTWKKELFVDDNTGANDIVMDPANPQVLVASTYQRQRKIYGGNGGGPGSGIYKSTDGGETWKKITKGLPNVALGRIGLHQSSADSKTIFADVEVPGGLYPAPAGADGDCTAPGGGRGQNNYDTGTGGVYRSTDGGETWEQLYSRSDQPQAYFVQMRTDPKDRNRVYRMALGLTVSDDAGKTWRPMNTRLHGDWHDLWVDPDDPNHMMGANDGGLGITWDRGITWEWKTNIPLEQFWEMGVDNRDPFMVCAGTQDNGSWCVPSAVRNRAGISNRDAFQVGGGDGMYFVVDPRDTNYAFTEVNSSSSTNSIQRISLANLQRQPAKPGVGRPKTCLEIDYAEGKGTPRRGPTGIPRGVGTDPAYRWGWVTPIVFSSITPGVVYSGSNVLFKSTDRGGSWKPISPDVTTRVNRDTVFIMGKKVGTVNYSPGAGTTSNPLMTPLFGTITAISESPLDAKVIYTATDDGQISVTKDGGTTWTNTTSKIPGLPPLTFASWVAASKFAPGRVYATFDGHFNHDDGTYVYVSQDFGQSWKLIIDGLPKTSIDRIAEDPRNGNVLVVGHAMGISFSNDAGAHWQSLNTNLPTVPVHAVVFAPHDNSLVVGTYARGGWILDDVGPLETLTASAMAKDAVLASITRGRQMNLQSLGPGYGEGSTFMANPEFDPAISYFVRDGASGEATITITDASGAAIRKMAGPAARGLNRVVWDMHMDGALSNTQGARGGRGGRGGGGGGGRGGGGGNGGPLVMPGKYSVAVAIPGIAQPLRGTVNVEADPIDAKFSAIDRRARQDALMELYRLQKTMVSDRAAVQALVDQGDAIKKDFGTSGAAADEINNRVVRIAAEFDRIEGLASTLMRSMEAFNAAPTVDQKNHIAWANDDASRAVAMLNRITKTEIPGLYAQHAKGTTPRTIPALPDPAGAIGKP